MIIDLFQQAICCQPQCWPVTLHNASNYRTNRLYQTVW